VRPTLKALLEGISDEEWVYWCIDDRYPLRVSDSQTLTQIHDYLVDNPSACSDYDAVRILRWREKTPKQHTAKNAIIAEQQFFEVRGGPGTGGLWHHQFCKAKFLKKFLNMDEKSGWQYLNEIKKSKTHKEMRILVPQKSLVSFVETCWQGKLLYQAGLDLKKYECQIPDLPKTPGNKSRIFTHRGEGPWFDKNHPDLNRWLENKNGN
jgi:hypothetical protein